MPAPTPEPRPDTPTPQAHPAGVWTRRRFLAATAATAAGLLSVGAIAEIATSSSAPASSPAPSAARQFLALASAAPASPGTSAQVSGGDVPGPTPGASASAIPAGADRQHFKTQPKLTPPNIHFDVPVSGPPQGTAAGFIFLTPANGVGTDGPTILDNDGKLVWLRPDSGGKYAADFAVQTLKGQPVLTWWEGTLNGGNGDGEYVIADASYTELRRVKSLNGYTADLHEFLLTSNNTALYLCGNQVAAPPGLDGTAPLFEDVIQEVNLDTGALVFEWHSADHVMPEESYVTPPTGGGQAYDYMHANSIEVDRDGNLLVSARNTSTLYKLDRTNGEVVWRLGGRRSDFAMGPGTTFAYQHDARRQPDGTITLFDDESPPAHGASRALTLKVDEAAMTATLVRELRQPKGLVSTSQGNAQALANGNTFVGWGAEPWFTEFAPDGTVLLNATFPAAGQSYRCYRFPWVSQPADVPLVVTASQPDGSLLVYASWNGATEVASWDVLAGTSAAALSLAASAPRSGFETAIKLASSAAQVAVQARDASGRLIGASEPVSVDA
jgi:hypothetical protein